MREIIFNWLLYQGCSLFCIFLQSLFLYQRPICSFGREELARARERDSFTNDYEEDQASQVAQW